MKTVTVEFLRKLGACSKQVELFVELFPDGAEVTEENVTKAIAGGMDVPWLSGRLPPAARAEYERIEGPARAEYERIQGTALVAALLALPEWGE